MPDGEVLHLAGMSCKYLIYIRIILIHNANATLPHQPAFAVQVLGKSCMFPFSDMIRFYIQKNADIKKTSAVRCNAMPCEDTSITQQSHSFSTMRDRSLWISHDSGVVFFTVSLLLPS